MRTLATISCRMPKQDTLETEETLPLEWLRVSDVVKFTGLSKATVHNLLKRGLIRNVSLRERGKIKGARLISYASLCEFLESRATGG